MTSKIENSKQIANNTAFLFLRLLFLLFISLLTSRVVLDKLGIVDFGIYNVVGGFVGIFSFLKTSFASVTQRFLNVEYGRNHWEKARQILNLHFMLYVGLVIALVVVLETLGLYYVEEKLVIPKDRLDIAITIYHFSVATICLNLLGIVYTSAIIAHENMKVFSFVGLVEGMWKLGIAYMISITTVDKLLLYGFLMMLLQFFMLLFNFTYCFCRYKECRPLYYWNKKDIKETSRFVGWDFFSNLALVFKDQFLTILLNLFFGPVVNSARAVTAQVNLAVSSFSGGFMISVKPQLVKSYAISENDYLKQLFFKSSKYSLYLIWLFCLPVMINASTILSIWLKEVPKDTDFFVVWNLLEAICAVLLEPCWTIIMASGKLSKYVMACNTAKLLVLPICYFSFYFGCGAVWAYIISFILRLAEVIIAVVLTSNIANIRLSNYFNQVVVPFLIVLVFSLAVVLLCALIIENNYLVLFVTTASSVIATSFSVLLWGSSKGERAYIYSFVKTKIKGASA